MTYSISSVLPLKSTDVVDIVAPSCGVSCMMMSKIIHFIEEELNLSYVLRPHWQQEHHPLYANSNTLRFESLVQALTSDHKIIWAIRGGSGLTALMPQLEAWANTLTSPPPYKLLIGFSDITALHLFLNQKWGWPTLHGPTLACLARNFLDDISIQRLKKFLFTSNDLKEENLEPLNFQAHQNHLIEAPIYGGNHSILQYSLGTSWCLENHHHILFLEDVHEEAYRIDARLQQFQQANIFKNVRALIFGDLYGITQPCPKKKFKIDYVLQNFVNTLSIPVLKMPGYGHTRQNKPLLFGHKAYLKTGSSIRLQMPLKSCSESENELNEKSLT